MTAGRPSPGWCASGEVVEPAPAARPAYDFYYAGYQEAYQRLRDLERRVAAYASAGPASS